MSKILSLEMERQAKVFKKNQTQEKPSQTFYYVKHTIVSCIANKIN